MFNNINISNSIVLVSPVYFSSLPFIVIRAMELIAKYRQSTQGNIPRFYVITNCGLPEAFHNNIAIENARLFAKQCNFEWSHGVGLGMGEYIIGRTSQTNYRINKKTKIILDKISIAISEQKEIPNDVIELAKNPPIPIWLYNVFANFYWKKQAKINAVLQKLYDTPYQL